MAYFNLKSTDRQSRLAGTGESRHFFLAKMAARALPTASSATGKPVALDVVDSKNNKANMTKDDLPHSLRNFL